MVGPQKTVISINIGTGRPDDIAIFKLIDDLRVNIFHSPLYFLLSLKYQLCNPNNNHYSHSCSTNIRRMISELVFYDQSRCQSHVIWKVVCFELIVPRCSVNYWDEGIIIIVFLLLARLKIKLQPLLFLVRHGVT